jgi:hypothetical protein
VQLSFQGKTFPLEGQLDLYADQVVFTIPSPWRRNLFLYFYSLSIENNLGVVAPPRVIPILRLWEWSWEIKIIFSASDKSFWLELKSRG